MDNIKVSIVIPVYNVQLYLRHCLDSVLSQSLQEIEIICVNDGSTDGSVQILREYNERGKIIVFDQENKGPGVARNKGIMLARGQYITFIDPDDYYATDEALETLYAYAERENAMICCGNIRDIKGNYIGKRFLKNEMMVFTGLQNCGYHVGTIFNLSFLKENNIYYPNYRRFQDPPFLTKAMIKAKEFYAVSVDTYIYRTGYKTLNVTEEIVVNVINGVRDILEMINANGNSLMEFAFYVFDGNQEFIIRNSCNRMKSLMILNAIKELNTVVCKVLGKEYMLTKEMMEDYQYQCINICTAIEDKKPIIIYGAGIVGKEIVKEIDNLGGNIVGVAVSYMDNNPVLIGKFQVREIVEYVRYADNAIIIIATGNKRHEEIQALLHKYCFKNRCVLTKNKLEYIRELLEKKVL